MRNPWTRDCEGMHGSSPREEQFAATASRASFAKVQHSPSPTCCAIFDSLHLAIASEYLDDLGQSGGIYKIRYEVRRVLLFSIAFQLAPSELSWWR